MVCASLPGIITGEGVHIHVPQTELYCAKKSRGGGCAGRGFSLFGGVAGIGYIVMGWKCLRLLARRFKARI